MKGKSITTLVIFFSLFFITLGDKILPKPLSTWSFQIRTSINNTLMGTFPEKEFKNPNKRTEDALKNTEQQGEQK